MLVYNIIIELHDYKQERFLIVENEEVEQGEVNLKKLPTLNSQRKSFSEMYSR